MRVEQGPWGSFSCPCRPVTNPNRALKVRLLSTVWILFWGKSSIYRSTDSPILFKILFFSQRTHLNTFSETRLLPRYRWLHWFSISRRWPSPPCSEGRAPPLRGSCFSLWTPPAVPLGPGAAGLALPAGWAKCAVSGGRGIHQPRASLVLSKRIAVCFSVWINLTLIGLLLRLRISF